MALGTSTPTDGPERHLLPATLLHDLRTPLNQIIGYSEMLVEQAEEAGNVAFLPDLQKLAKAGQNLLSLFNGNFVSDSTEASAVSFEKPVREPFVESI